MKAIVCTKYGSPDILQLRDVQKPVPAGNQVLVKIHAVSLNAADWHMLRGDPLPLRFVSGLLKPKNPILGADIAGEVEAVGPDVTQFKPGDSVFGDLSASGWGGFAEYVCAQEDALALKPAQLSFEQAAAVPMAAVTALQGLRTKGRVEAGHHVLIYGASGGVGTFAVQIAKALGATVTAVCSSKKMDLVRSLGADEVVDYTKEDFSTHDQRYDLILAVNGYRPLSEYKRMLKPTGTYLVIGGSMGQLFQAMLLGPWVSMGSKKKIGNVLAAPNKTDLLFMKELLEAGRVIPVIDREYPLSKVPEAVRYLEEGHAKGKIVISLKG